MLRAGDKDFSFFFLSRRARWNVDHTLAAMHIMGSELTTHTHPGSQFRKLFD